LYRKAITKLNVDAIVNAANDELANIGGVAEVIEKAAGPQMKRVTSYGFQEAWRNCLDFHICFL
jgi:O-acetyl-ADP-ribose deacetylase (regulator of RNase III)